MGLFLNWSRHYRTQEYSRKEVLFETYYYRHKYAFCVGSILPSEKEGTGLLSYKSDARIHNGRIQNQLPTMDSKITQQLTDLEKALESTETVTLQRVKEILTATVPNIGEKLDSQLSEPMSKDNPLLLLLTVPTHPHKGALKWQFAVIKL